MSDSRILRWVVLKSSHLKNRLAAFASVNSLGTQGTVRVPIPGSTFQNLCTILCFTCVCIQKSQNFCILLPYLMHKTLQGKKPGELSRRLTLAPSTESKRQHPGQNNRVAFPFSRGIFPTQGSNPGLPHCRRILYQLSYKGSSGILEWVAYPFSSRSSWPRSQTGFSCIGGRFFTN